MRILDIGAGENPKYENSDTMDLHCNPTYKWDMNKTPYPIKSNYYDIVVMRQSLEHTKIENFIKIMKEITRITKKGGRIEIEVPHASSLITRYSNYQHNCKGFVVHSFDFGDITKQKIEKYYQFNLWKVKKVRIRFGKLHRILGLEFLFNLCPKMQDVYELFFYGIFPAREIYYVLIVR